MLKSKIAVAALAAMLVFTSANVSVAGKAVAVAAPSNAAPVAVWLIAGCASGIILAAVIANARDGRPLTHSEAATCGFLFWLNQQRPR